MKSDQEWIDFDKEIYKSVHENEVNNMLEWIKNIEDDPDKTERNASHICKYCFYHPPRGCLPAVTIVSCKDCKIKMEFSDSRTDRFCYSCAKKQNACKKCGAEMD